jgi:hypothetical protein
MDRCAPSPRSSISMQSLVHLLYRPPALPASRSPPLGAYQLARLGFRAKELLGGLDWWRRDGHPVVTSTEPGSLLAAAEC